MDEEEGVAGGEKERLVKGKQEDGKLEERKEKGKSETEEIAAERIRQGR